MASRGRSNFSGRVKKYRPVRDEDGGDDDYAEDSGLIGATETFDFAAGDEEAEATSKRFADIDAINAFDEQMGFVHYAAGPPKMGWMLNMRTVNFWFNFGLF